MFVQREPHQWYLGGTIPAFSGPEPYGWVERLDLSEGGAGPDALQPVARSPRLPCGGHVWCGSILAHANGAVYSVNGSYLHKLDPDDLSVLAERRLSVDRSHNGMLALRDGTIVTKDLRLEGQDGTTLTRLEPGALEPAGEPLVLPEASMGRIAVDVVEIDGELTELVYVPGTEHLWRLIVGEPGRAGGGCGLEIDETWRPRYRAANGRQGLAWDCCISAGDCWIMDCGDIESVRAIHRTEPNGRFDEPPGSRLSWRRPVPWSGAQRLLRSASPTTATAQRSSPSGLPAAGSSRRRSTSPTPPPVSTWPSPGTPSTEAWPASRSPHALTCMSALEALPAR